MQVVTMKNSPVYPKYETNDYNDDEYNHHADFSLFLEEAKQNESIKVDSMVSQAKPKQEDVPKTRPEQEKKRKNPWKALLLPWWKGEKKSDKPQMTSSRGSNAQRGFASGPIFSGDGMAAAEGRPHRRPFSGPLMSSLFNPIRKAETEIPYVCLDSKNYGPVYLVT